MTQHHIPLIGLAGPEPALFTEAPADGLCGLVCVWQGGEIHAQAADYFEALCMIRQRLEAEGLMPLCHGASFDVFPSAMAREMGGGLQAYRLRIGHPASCVDLVPIFETGADVQPASVAQQRAYFDAWLASLRR